MIDLLMLYAKHNREIAPSLGNVKQADSFQN